MGKHKPFACPKCGKPAKFEVADLIHLTIDPVTGAIGTRPKVISHDLLYTGGDFSLWCERCNDGWDVTFDHETRRVTKVGEPL